MNALNETSLQVADEFRDIDPEERSDVRAIAHQSHVYIQRIKEKKIEFREKLLFLDFLVKNSANMQTIAIASLLDL